MSDSQLAERAPDVVQRPKLAVWMFARGLRMPAAARTLGVSTEQVRRWCAAFDDPIRRIPRPEMMRRIVDWTGGEVTPADFYPEAGA